MGKERTRRSRNRERFSMEIIPTTRHNADDKTKISLRRCFEHHDAYDSGNDGKVEACDPSQNVAIQNANTVVSLGESSGEFRGLE